jgi:hypothetical protein
MLEVSRDAIAAGEEHLDGLNGCYAACGCGTEYRCGALLEGRVLRRA